MEDNKLIEDALEIGRSFLERQKIQEAEIVLNQILKIERNLKALHLLGLTKYANKKYKEAECIFLDLIKDNVNPEYLNNLSLTYSAMGDFESALSMLHSAVKIDPKNSNYYSNLGLCYRQSNKIQEALECFKKAIELNENNVYAWINLGSAYGKTKNLEEAIRCLKHATKLDPDNKTIRVNLAYAYLLKGDMQNGWLEYENRWDSFKQLEYFKKKYDQNKKWNGIEDLTGKTILIHCEQGAGDTIQFSRFIPNLKQNNWNCNILFQVPEELVKLFQKNSVRAIEGKSVNSIISKVSSSFKDSEYDFFCSVISLPYLLKIHDLQAKEKYIGVNNAANFNRYGQLFKIGITWAGNPKHPNDINRSCNLSHFKCLQSPGVKLFSLQKDVSKRQYNFHEKPIDLTEGCEDMSLVDMSPHLTDFQKTAMAIQSLDLIITADTAVLHLAGAMGKETWGLIPYNPDWRWGLTGKRTAWYPSVRLFRQPNLGDWTSVFREIKNCLDHTKINKGEA